MQETAAKTPRNRPEVEGDPMATSDSSHEPHKTETGPEHIAPANPDFSSTFDEFAGVFRRDDSTFLGERGQDYEPYKRAYDFGYRMGVGNRFAKKDWAEAEPELQREWEADNGDWSKAREAVRQGWEGARGAG